MVYRPAGHPTKVASAIKLYSFFTFVPEFIVVTLGFHRAMLRDREHEDAPI